MSLRKRIVAFIAMLGLSLGAAALNVQPASAAGLGVPNKTSTYDYRICNSSASMAWIKVWDQYSGVYDYLFPDQCRWYFNDADNIRVDVDPDNNAYPDIESYKIGHIDYGYGPCHEGENSASNPDNGYSPEGARYRNYVGHYCSNGTPM